MFNYPTSDYVCPICPAVKQVESDATLIVPNDIVYQDDHVTAFINSFFVGQNPGHVIVVPNQHIENIYDMPDELGAKIFSVARMLAIALRNAYNCDGITVQQNNEPAGGQHAFHYHMHLFPRYANDTLYSHPTDKRLAPPEERSQYAEKLRGYLKDRQ